MPPPHQETERIDMLTLKEIDDCTHHASDFGNGHIELTLTLSGDVTMTMNIHVANVNDTLETYNVVVGDCVDEEENPVDYTTEEADAIADQAIALNDGAIWYEYEQAVYDAQRERASEPDDGW